MNFPRRQISRSSAKTIAPSRPGLTIFPAIVLALLCGLSWAESPKPNEYDVKAAYLYNFGRFVQWPENPAAVNSSDFFICVLGNDPFGTSLERTIAQETIDGRKVVAKRVVAVQAFEGCRILFISASENMSVRRHLLALRNMPVLTVSDMPNFTEKGGMIQFVLEGNRVRFDVNLAATEKAGLSLSSQLLKVANAIQGRTPRK